MSECKGAMFLNDKEGNENRPDFKGKLEIDDKVLYVSAWKSATKEGKPYLSIKGQWAEERNTEATNKAWEGVDFNTNKKEEKKEPEVNDEIPF